MKEEPKIEIALKDYHELLLARGKLACLYAVGVDDWEGYEKAMEMFWDE